MTSTLKFWAAIAPSVLAVAALAVSAELRFVQGDEVRLEVRPYDPMDALSGRYIAAPLAITTLEIGALRNECDGAQPGDNVWVQLERGEPWWTPRAVLCAPKPGTLALRGTLRARSASVWTVDYELDRYYIPHYAADPSAQMGDPRPQIIAVVRVDESGAGIFSDLLVDGESYADWNARQPMQGTQR